MHLSISLSNEYSGSLAYEGGRPLCHGPPQTLKMKKCKVKPSSFSKSKAGFSRVFGVHSGFRFSSEKTTRRSDHLLVEVWTGRSGYSKTVIKICYALESE